MQNLDKMSWAQGNEITVLLLQH